MTIFNTTIVEMLSAIEVEEVWSNFAIQVNYDFFLNGKRCRLHWKRSSPGRIVFKFKKHDDDLVFKMLAPNYVDMIRNPGKYNNTELMLVD